MIKSLGEHIRGLRDAQDVSLREFARKLKITAAHLSDVELGRRFPSDALLEAIARGLGVPFDELQAHDSRPPVEDLKRRAEADPSFGFALRKLVEHEISTEELLRLIEERDKDPEK